MTAIRTAIMTACFMGIVSTVVNILLPVNSLRKHLMSILGLISLLAVIRPFMAEGFELSFDEIDFGNSIRSETESVDRSFEDIFLEQAEVEYDEYFYELLNKNDIRTEKVRCTLRLNGDNELELVSVEIKIRDISQRESARYLIENETSGTEIIILQAENDGTAEITDKQTKEQS